MLSEWTTILVIATDGGDGTPTENDGLNLGTLGGTFAGTGTALAETGQESMVDTMLVLASDHSHGVGLPIDLPRTYDQEQLTGSRVPLTSVML